MALLRSVLSSGEIFHGGEVAYVQTSRELREHI